MRRNLVALVKHPHQAVAAVHFNMQAHILMRHRVVVTRIVDVIIDADLGPLDVNVLIRMPWQGSKCRLLQTREGVEPIAGHLFERALIQIVQKFSNALIELRQ